jgi:ribosomal protein S17E
VLTDRSTPETLSEAGLIGVGALVGLFSKEAIEKLRELFNTLFSTRKNIEESLLERMPEELREKVRGYLDPTTEGGETKH